ncbi:type II toxin-antitoxin system RelE/ParE family toxin [Planctomycetota bacterium]
MYEIRLKRSVVKFLKDQEKKVQRQIYRHIESLSENPFPVGCKKLEDDIYRVRSGVYRIIYHVRQQKLVIDVVKIGHRQSVYKHLDLQ